jgi:hypothetical protein
MSTRDITHLLYHLASQPQCNLVIIEQVLEPLSFTGIDISLAGNLLQPLALLHHHMPQSHLLEQLICQSLCSILPIGCNKATLSTSHFQSHPWASVCLEAQTIWANRTCRAFEELEISDFLCSTRWTEDTVRIIQILLYQDHSACSKFLLWLTSMTSIQRTPTQLAQVITVYLDVCIASQEYSVNLLSRIWEGLYNIFLSSLLDAKISADQSTVLKTCVLQMLSASKSTMTATAVLQPLEQLLDEYASLVLTADFIAIIIHTLHFPSLKSSQQQLVVDKTLEWTAKYFSAHVHNTIDTNKEVTLYMLGLDILSIFDYMC